MAKLKTAIGRMIAQLITSTTIQRLSRTAFSVVRKVLRRPATIHYFHQPDDPYSQLLAPILPTLQSHYRVVVVAHTVPPPDPAAAPDLARLRLWSERDAERLASDLPESTMKAPRASGNAATSAETNQGAQLRKRLGHYLGATLYFEGEWYWGVDRLHYLETRLLEAGLGLHQPDGLAPTVMLYPPRGLQLKPLRDTFAKPPVIHFYCSLRSPYTYLAARKVRQLANHFGAELRLRFVLPMVMRGLPVPLAKRLYILRDSKREAQRLGLPFGAVVDPVGKPVESGLALLHAAINMGKGAALLESFLEGVFAQGIDASSEPGLRAIATRAGLSSSEMESALADDSWRAIAEANRTDMLQRGLWGVPSFRVNDMPLLWGQDRLWMLEEDLIATLHGNGSVPQSTDPHL